MIHDDYRRSNTPPTWKTVSRSQPCAKCGKSDQCSVDEAGDWCLCYRVEGGKAKQGKDGRPYWVHRLTPWPERAEQWPAPRFRVEDGKGELADPDVLDLVYSKLIGSLRLEPAHYNALAKRKFLRMHAEPKGYRSLAPCRARAVQSLIKAGLEQHLPRVPGFITKQNKQGNLYWTLAGWGGMVIPIRSGDGKIAALQIRVDEQIEGGKYRMLTSKKYGGPGPGSPVHHPLFDGDKTTVRVTEGALKADVATHLSGMLTIGLPGVGTWSRAAPALTEIGAKTVRVAFDADARTNAAVGRALLMLVNDLAERGFVVELERWPAEHGKGIDDVLAAGHQPEVIQGDDVLKIAGEIATEAELHAPKPVAPAAPPPPRRNHEQAVAAIQAGHANEEEDDPHLLARIFLGIDADRTALPRFVYHREEWLEYTGANYRSLNPGEVRAQLNLRVKHHFDHLNRLELQEYHQSGGNGDNGPPTAIPVTSALETNVYKAACGLARISGDIDPPAWIGAGSAPHPANEIVAMRNGLLHLPSLAAGRPDHLLPHTPRFFTRNATGYDFDPSPPEPKEWFAFLRSLWPDDPQSVELLQQWFGYALLPDTRQGKIMLMIGPPRSGKGTIIKVLQALVGKGNTCSPTMSGLGTQFGLWPLLGKSLAIIQDARLSGKNDLATITERLLSISGEDEITIDRKCLSPITCRLPIRFVVVSNELPRLNDASGALANRLVILELRRGFLGCEDFTLADRLLTELPSILHWVVQGWDRLRQHGRFILPDSSRELAEEMEDITSPVSVFVRERCVRGPNESVSRRNLFEVWQVWCEMRGFPAGNDAVFGRNLRAAFPDVRSTRPNAGTTRPRHYQGIGLIPPVA